MQKNFGHRMGASPGNVYGAMNHKGFLLELLEEDMASLLAPLSDQGWKWDAAIERLVIPGNSNFLNFNTPWCHAKGTPHKHCSLDHMVLFNIYGIIPPRCQHCWKVVVAPNTVKQLFDLEQLELRKDVPSKCGIELRDYTPRHYGGYFYNHSLEEGREKYELVREAMDKEIEGGKDIDVILKRGCTEFELVKGPSPFWCTTKEEERLIDIIDSYVEMPQGNKPQSELIKQNVRIKWLYWAFANGDKTYKMFNGGQNLYTPPVLYHEGDLEGMKADIARGRAGVLAGVKPDMSSKFLKVAQSFSEEHDISLDRLKITLGDETEGSPLSKIPKEVIGEHDELT